MTFEAHKRAPAEDPGYELTPAEAQTGSVFTQGAGVSPGGARTGRYAGGALIAGKYQLGQILGEGGMGSVWVAKNRTLDVEVAIKLMRSELTDDVDGIAERMLQEARAAASIGHPSIIQVFDFGFTELGDPFIAMELLRGESLSQAIRRRGRINPVRAAQTLLPIIDALSAAHRRRIVHRDLKPENIFLARPAGHRLQPKVLDFGIAKLEQRAAERLTRDGAVIGSPAYMAPEQLRGDPDIDGRVDVWALGVVLYQMITGARPFEGANYHASMWNIAHSEPRPLAELGVSDPELWRIVQSCLMKEPRARCPDMRTFGQSLAKWLLAQGVQEDVGNASLTAWLEEKAPSSAAVRSFFPSNAPVREPPRDTGELSSGTRRIVVPKAQKVDIGSKPEITRLTRYAILVLAAALAAFVSAALWTSGEEPVETFENPPEPQVPARVRETAPPAPRHVSPRDPRGVLSPLASTVAADVELSAQPAPPSSPASVSKRPTPARAKQNVAKSDLKDPFQ